MNEHHSEQLVAYMRYSSIFFLLLLQLPLLQFFSAFITFSRFAKYQRSQCIRSVRAALQVQFCKREVSVDQNVIL